MKNHQIIFKIFFIILFLIGCSSKKTSILKDKKVEKERKETRKDSVSEVKNEMRTFEFSSEVGTISEMEIISDKEKDSVIYERIRSPTAEKIIVRGGSLRFKTTHHTADKITKKDTLNIENKSVRTILEEEKVAERKIFTKEEKKEARKQTLYILLFLIAMFFVIWFLKSQKSS